MSVYVSLPYKSCTVVYCPRKKELIRINPFTTCNTLLSFKRDKDIPVPTVLHVHSVIDTNIISDCNVVIMKNMFIFIIVTFLCNKSFFFQEIRQISPY